MWLYVNIWGTLVYVEGSWRWEPWSRLEAGSETLIWVGPLHLAWGRG